MTGKYVYPWDSSKFKGNQFTKDRLYDLMYKRGYPLKKIEVEPDDSTKKGIDMVLNAFFKEKAKPWMLVMSNSLELLQSLAIYVPSTVCLTTRMKVFNSSVEDMLRFYRARLPRDDFEVDPAGEAVHSLTHAGFLVLDGITQGGALSLSYAGSFYNTLSKRAGLRNARTMFPVLSEKTVSAKSVSQVFADVKNGFGVGVTAIIEQKADVLGVTKKIDKLTIRKGQV